MNKKFSAIAASVIATLITTSTPGWCSFAATGVNENTNATNPTIVTGSAIVENYKCGDLNGDSSVDAIDFALLKSYILEKIKVFPVADALAAGDLNSDGSINSIDLAIMKMYLLGNVKELPITETKQQLYINEVMATNTSTLRDGDVEDKEFGALGGAYSDWIEIFNSGSTAVDLKGYTLSDSSATWEFPTVTIPAKGYLIVWADDKNKVAKNGQLHSNFKISASGETVTLKKADGSIVDNVTIVALKNDESYGRKSDGASDWAVFSGTSPLKSNVYSAQTMSVKEPVFSQQGGFYTSSFNLTLSTGDANTKIYYTMNGSDPIPNTEGTFEFTQPINIKSRAGDPNVLSMISNISNDMMNRWIAPNGELFKCTNIKAVAINDGGNKSKIITNSYFVDKDMKTRYNMPVISLVTDYDNFFDNTKGIYVNGNFEKKGDQWERPIHIEFFEKNGTLAFSQNSGVRINGGYTKKFPQKSLRLYADHGYDETDKYNYEIFPGLKKKANGKKLDSFESIILRNAGNDCTSSGTMFRDGLTQGLVSHLKLDTIAFRPSVVFLNGEYWGLYNLRERYDTGYLKSHYNVEKDKAVILEVLENPVVSEGEDGDSKLYQDEVINYLKANDITNKATYEYIKTKIDIDNYINYNVAEIYCGNTDWPGNNMSIWKYKTDDGQYHPEATYGKDGRWRWMLKDTDFGFGFSNQSVSFDSLTFATTDTRMSGAALNSNTTWAVYLLQTLMKNPEFRTQFINCFADQLNTSFDSTRVNKKIDELKAAIEAVMPEHCNRWGMISMKTQSSWGGWSGNTTWDTNISSVKNYATNRPAAVRGHIVNKFKASGVTGTAEVTLKANPTEGYVKVNTIDIKSSTPGITESSNWTGTYFKGVAITLTAVAESGYKFDHWEGVTGVSQTAASITFIPENNISIKPVFIAQD